MIKVRFLRKPHMKIGFAYTKLWENYACAMHLLVALILRDQGGSDVILVHTLTKLGLQHLALALHFLHFFHQLAHAFYNCFILRGCSRRKNVYFFSHFVSKYQVSYL